MKKLQTNSKAYVLNTIVSGHGPVLVLLHGFLANAGYWKRTTALLEQDYTVVSIDLLGFGKSPKPLLSDYGYEAQISSIKLTLEKLAITEPFILVGHSMGSLISLRYTNMYPDSIKRLFLVNMPIMLTPKEVKDEIYRSKVARLGLHPVAQYAIWGLFTTAIKLRILPARARNTLKDRKNYPFQHNGVSRVRSFRNVIVDGAVEADLQRVKIQTTLVSGIQDRAIYMQNLMKLVLPATISLENVNAAHHVPFVMPELIAKLLKDDA